MSNRPRHALVVPTTGFSLAELVIVIAIIGVIAAIAVRRSGGVIASAGEGALKANLHSLRGAIETYAAEHGGVFPALDKKKGTFIAQLTMKTDDFGNVGNTSGVHVFGPYLRDGVPRIPVGPNVGATEVHVTNRHPLANEVNEGRKNRAWVYHHLTGQIIANTDDLDDAGKSYASY